MTPLGFLALALVVSVIGSLVVVAVNRRKPTPYDELDDFERQMRALSPDPGDARAAIQASLRWLAIWRSTSGPPIRWCMQAARGSCSTNPP
ncbi:MAG: hypothetical protein V9G12_24695 [Microthrixaceae bacterium]